MAKLTLIVNVKKRMFHKNKQTKRYLLLKKANKLFDIDEGNITFNDTKTLASL
jgi:hypothetical protein